MVEMSVFVQSLENRVLLSAAMVTGVALAADYGTVAAGAAGANGALKTLNVELKADNATLGRDLKGLAKSNAGLLKQLKLDEAGMNKSLTADLNGLVKATMEAAKKGAIDGDQLANNPSPTVLGRATAESGRLGSMTAMPLADLDADLSSTSVISDMNALAAANAGDTVLAGHVAAATSQVAGQESAIGTAAGTFVTDVGALNADLQSVIAAVPSGVATENFISELGVLRPKLNGSVHYTRGDNVLADKDDLEIHIDNVDGSGNISGNLSGGFTSDDVTLSLHDASVTAKGKFSAEVVTSILSVAKLSGQFTINPSSGVVTLKGTFQDGLTKGDFTATG